MNGKNIFAIYASATVLSCGLLAVTPWAIVLAVACIGCSLIPVMKDIEHNEKVAAQYVLIKLELDTVKEELKLHQVHLKRATDDVQIALNRVNASIGIRK